MKTPPAAPRRRPAWRAAFTLIEMMVALAVFVLLMGGIFAIAQGTMELGNDLAFVQDRSAVRQNFISFLRRSYRNLPGDAEVRLKVQQVGGRYVPTINVVNGGTSFTPGSALPPNTSVDLFAEERPGGYLRIGIRLLDEKQTAAVRAGQNVRFSGTQNMMPLMDNVTRFEWRFYNAATNRWENNWKESRKPLMAEMNLQLDDGFETRAVFWLPPVIPNVVATTPVIPPEGGTPVPNPDGTVPPPDPNNPPGPNPP